MSAELDCLAHSLITDVAMLSEGSVLLVRYKDVEQYDGETGWFLPDDEMRRLEHPGRAALRIAEEQLGVRLEAPRLGVIESFQGNNGTWHLSFHYVAEVPSLPEVSPSPIVEEARWFPLSNLPPRSDVAHHGWALTVLEKILSKNDVATIGPPEG
ncbi:MAG: NUDIX domain-containing protein [Actinobacteria bacterium]|nr:MAG: NUDIX domain-containing protein [Actinomycetota bacterium]